MLSAHTVAGSWPEEQASLATLITQRLQEEGEQYFSCAANSSVAKQCPTVLAHWGKEGLDLAIPPEARWVFSGPSYLREIYLVMLLGNAPPWAVASRLRRSPTALLAPREEDFSSPKPPHVLPNGAIIAFWEGGQVPDWMRSVAWTHGFFMQPHNPEYWTEHQRAAAEKREASMAAFADADGKDMCMLMERWKLNNAPAVTAFDEYLNCTKAKTARDQFYNFLPQDAKFTLVVPWPATQHVICMAAPGVGPVEDCCRLTKV